MKIKDVKSQPGDYVLVSAETFGHLTDTVEAYGEWNGNPLVGMLLQLADGAERVEVLGDDDAV